MNARLWKQILRKLPNLEDLSIKNHTLQQEKDTKEKENEKLEQQLHKVEDVVTQKRGECSSSLSSILSSTSTVNVTSVNEPRGGQQKALWATRGYC